MSETYIPASALRMAIVMVNAADQCDQAGQWDRDHRRACKHILDWIGSNDYKITCEKAGASAYICDQDRPAKPLTNSDRIRQMTDEELAKHIIFTCDDCAYLGECLSRKDVTCESAHLEWLRKEAEEDAGSKTD